MVRLLCVIMSPQTPWQLTRLAINKKDFSALFKIYTIVSSNLSNISLIFIVTLKTLNITHSLRTLPAHILRNLNTTSSRIFYAVLTLNLTYAPMRVTNKSDLLWLFFLKKQSTLRAYQAPSVRGIYTSLNRD